MTYQIAHHKTIEGTFWNSVEMEYYLCIILNAGGQVQEIQA